MNNIARVVPVKSKGEGVVPTHGTAILLADGSTLGGVQRIVITGDLDDVWRAELRLLINPADFQVLLDRVRFRTDDDAKPLTNDQLSMLAMVIRHEAGTLFGEVGKT